MVRAIKISFFVIGILTLIVWTVSVFIQPLLPQELNNSLILFVMALAGTIAFLAGIKDVIELVQSIFPASKSKKEVPLSEDVLIANISIDEDQCDWHKPPGENIIFHNPKRPEYMKFIKFNDVIVDFEKLDSKTQKVFDDVVSLLKSRLAENLKTLKKSIDSKYITRFAQLSPADFYASLVILNRAPSIVKGKDKTYTVRTSSFLDIDGTGDDYTGEYYTYDLNAVRAIKLLVPQLWLEREEYESLVSSGSIGESLKIFNRIFMRTTNPIFDITLVNTSQSTEILHRFEIVIEDIWTEIKAGPTAQILKPINTYQFVLDFSKRNNSYSVEPQISFGAEQAARFKIQLLFSNVSGNCANIRFIFFCNQGKIESDVYELSF